MSGIFVYGFGNPGRRDDGLGPEIVRRLEEDGIEGVETDSNYQLNIEDAYNISRSFAVIFVDASVDCSEPFDFFEIGPSEEITFTTHSMHPKSVLALCNELYNDRLKAYILAVRGYSFEFEEGLSDRASDNLNSAYLFLKNKIEELYTERNSQTGNIS